MAMHAMTVDCTYLALSGPKRSGLNVSGLSKYSGIWEIIAELNWTVFDRIL